jgi:hypothetical protein
MTRRELGAMGEMSGPSAVRAVRLTAMILNRAICRTCAALTLQEGLYSAYLRDLRLLIHLEQLPGDMPDVIAALTRELGADLGFDGATGRKQRPSTLTAFESKAFLARLQALRVRAEMYSRRI